LPFATRGERGYAWSVNAFLKSLARFVPSIGGWSRRLWCNHQRRRLVGVTTRVVWVSPERVEWAVWGAKHQFFHAEWAGSLLYLRGR